MKKMVFALPLLLGISILQASEQQVKKFATQEEVLEYLENLQREGLDGDLISGRAYVDFGNILKDPCYKIRLASRILLIKNGLLEAKKEKEKVPDYLRKLLKQENKKKDCAKECGICLDEGSLMKLECGHSYHRHCVESWCEQQKINCNELQTHRNAKISEDWLPECPDCREPIPSSVVKLQDLKNNK